MERNKILKCIKIDGILDLTKNQMTANEFTDKFIEWVEQNSWQFGGTTGEYKDEFGDFE